MNSVYPLHLEIWGLEVHNLQLNVKWAGKASIAEWAGAGTCRMGNLLPINRSW